MSTNAPLQAQAAKPQAAGQTPQASLLARQHGHEESTFTLSERPAWQRDAFFPARLALGPSQGPLEQEADRVADQVLGAPAHSGPAIGAAPPHIQRFTAQAGTPGAAQAPASVGRVLSEPGSPLEPVLRQDMERRFGHDFSRVRVHCSESAAQSARSLAANAYTVGHDIAFAAGRFAPGTQAGRRLLAHELTHVVQQSQAPTASPSNARPPGANISHSDVLLARDMDAGAPADAGASSAPRDAAPVAGVPAGAGTGVDAGTGSAPAAAPARAPVAAGPSATIGAVTFRGSSNRIAPTQTATVAVTLSGLPAGGSAAIDVEGSGGANGSATITAGASLTASGNVTVRGDTQTTPGNAGRLKLRASVGAAVVGRSAGFTVAAWPTDFTISRNADINTATGVGLRVNIGCVSDGSGALAELNEAEHTERVDIGSRDNPPFTVPGAISATGTGTSSFMPATSSPLVDRHGYAKASIVTTGLAPGFYTLVYRQNFLFNDRRTGVTNAVVRNSGFTITHSVLVMDLPIVGRFSTHMTIKRGAAVTVEGKAATAGSGTADSDGHPL
ncbi:MAG: eCIS core domain-containing protein [Polaromonas sp.]